MAKMIITKETLEDLYINKQINQTNIGKMYDVDRKNIDYYLKKYNIPKRTQKETLLNLHKDKGYIEIEEHKLKEMVSKGILINEIAEYYNVNRYTIRRAMDKYNMPSMLNHKGQTNKHSEYMKTNNPVPKGSERPQYVVDALIDAHKKYARDRWDNISDFKKYAKTARHIAYTYYERCAPEGFEIDHIFSVKDGWDNNVYVEDISHPKNLRIITVEENRAKHSKSLITIEEFYKLIGKNKE